jgi:ATP/ADP translocase
MTADSSGRGVLAAAFLAAAMIAGQVASKTVRDALFLSEISAERLPVVMIASALLASVAAGRAFAAWSPQRVVPFALLIHAMLFAGEWVLCATAPAVVAVILYLHIGALAALAVSAFWSLVAESFDPHSAKRAIARIGTAATLGGLLGGVTMWQMAERVSLPNMLLALAGAYLVLALGTALQYAKRVPAAVPGIGATSGPDVGGFELVRRTPYLRLLAALVVLVAIGDAGLDLCVLKTHLRTFVPADCSGR